MTDGAATLTGRGHVTATLKGGNADSALLIGRGTIFSWLLPTTGNFKGTFAALGSIVVTGPKAGDWVNLIPASGTPTEGLREHRAVFDGTAWRETEEYVRGPTGSDYTSWRFEIGDATYPARYWDGVDTTTTHQKFSVDAAGNVVVSGTLAAGAIDIPGTGSTGFHVASDGETGIGGTTAVNGKFHVAPTTGDVTSAGSFIISGTGSFKTGTSGSRLELGAGKGDIDIFAVDGTRHRFTPQNSNILHLDLTNGSAASGTLRVRNAYASGVATLQVIGSSSSKSAYLVSDNAGYGYLQLEEGSAPGTPTANSVSVYAKDKAGVSALYWKNDAGTEFDLSAAGGTLTRAVWFKPGTMQADTASSVALNTGANSIRAMAFSDGATERVDISFQVPADYVSGGSWIIHWVPGSTDAVAHTVRWSHTDKVLAAGTNITTAGTTTNVTGASAARTANVTVVEAAMDDGITVAALDHVQATLGRIGGDVTFDTYVGVVNVVLVEWSYTAST
jgi:hypothetical protein